MARAWHGVGWSKMEWLLDCAAETGLPDEEEEEAGGDDLVKSQVANMSTSAEATGYEDEAAPREPAELSADTGPPSRTTSDRSSGVAGVDEEPLALTSNEKEAEEVSDVDEIGCPFCKACRCCWESKLAAGV